jgi:hypothetical protein
MMRRNLSYVAGWSTLLCAVIFAVVLGGPPASGAPDRTAAPTPTPVPGIEGNVFVDFNQDGKWRTTTEPGLTGVTVSVAGRTTTTGYKGFFQFDALRTNRAYTVQITPPAGYVGLVTSRTVYLVSGQRVLEVYLTLLPANTATPSPTASLTASLTPTETPTPTPSPTNIATTTSTATPTATETSTPTVTVTPSATPPSATPPSATPPSATPTSTFCPQTTPEPLWVEPVTSPTDLLAQTLIVGIGNGDAVTVTTASGVFTRTGDFGAYGNPARVEISLLPDTTHHLSVAAHVRRVIGWGGCVYGDYTLSTDRDRTGAPLIIQQVAAAETPTPTVTPTSTATPTPTPSMTPTVTPRPRWRQYLPLLLR